MSIEHQFIFEDTHVNIVRQREHTQQTYGIHKQHKQFVDRFSIGLGYDITFNSFYVAWLVESMLEMKLWSPLVPLNRNDI